MVTEINLLDRNSKKLIEGYQKERIESDTRLVSKVSLQLEGLSSDLQKEHGMKMESLQIYDSYLQDDLPKLKEDVVNEEEVRQEVEQRIFDQFMEQLQELKVGFDEERKEREDKEEELVAILQNVSAKIKEAIASTKKER